MDVIENNCQSDSRLFFQLSVLTPSTFLTTVNVQEQPSFDHAGNWQYIDIVELSQYVVLVLIMMKYC